VTLNGREPRPGTTVDLVIRQCRVEGQPASAAGDLVDIAVDGDRIVAAGRALPLLGLVELQADGRLASPAFVQPHIHLDKVLSARMLGPNRSGTLPEAIELLHRTKRSSTVEDVARRAGEVIRSAVLSGTTFIRSHVDVDTIGGLVPLYGVLLAAREHADICEVEIVAFPQEGLLRDPGAAELMVAAMSAGAGVVGGMPHWELDGDGSRGHIEQCLNIAERYDADVDMHIDETDDAGSRTFEMLLDATERHGWEGRVTAGHCCSMAAWDTQYLKQMIHRAAELRVGVVTNPTTNLLLQGRADVGPQRRGLPPVKDLVAGGVNVACGQDCVDDAFYPFGTANQLQVALILCHAAQLSTPEEIAEALAMVRHRAAAVVGLDAYGLDPGCRADVVVLDAENATEALRAQAAPRWVIRDGRVVAETTTATSLRREPSMSQAEGG
jgi:cytosine/creatinine deaminase